MLKDFNAWTALSNRKGKYELKKEPVFSMFLSYRMLNQ